MADTYTQLYIQFIFAVQNRTSLILPEWETELYKYITGIIRNKSHKMIAINGMPDHLHLFIGFQPVDHMSELIKVIKGESSKWITKQRLVKGRFQWQEGYGAFPIAGVISTGFIIISEIKKNITRRKPFGRNISTCSKNSMSI